MSTNFHLAPPPKTVDGLQAVPIDIQTITGQWAKPGGPPGMPAVAHCWSGPGAL